MESVLLLRWYALSTRQPSNRCARRQLQRSAILVARRNCGTGAAKGQARHEEAVDAGLLCRMDGGEAPKEQTCVGLKRAFCCGRTRSSSFTERCPATEHASIQNPLQLEPHVVGTSLRYVAWIETSGAQTALQSHRVPIWLEEEGVLSSNPPANRNHCLR